MFSRAGVYGSAQAFVDGFAPALWVGAGLSALGIAAAAMVPGRRSAVAAIPALATE